MSEGELFQGYDAGVGYDEMFESSLAIRPHYRGLYERLHAMKPEEFRRRKAMTDLSMLQDGVGFTVYRQEEGIERVWPMDPVPRIIPADEWEHIERGLVQRITALNLFLKDLYHDQHILRDRVIDPRLDLRRRVLPPRVHAARRVPRDIYIHVCGTDLIRDADGRYLVLEDNGRTPSGVSYMLQNRQVLKRVFPQIFEQLRRARDRRLPGGAARRAEVHRAGRPARSDGRAAQPGHVQLGLLRAHVPRPAHGHRAGRGPRPRRRPEPRLHAHDPRAASASTSSTAGSTTISSTR